MVLLHLMAEAVSERGWKLAVAHFNHKLRGRASDADEALVREAAKSLGFRCIIASWNRAARERETKGVGLEMAAREARLQFLGRTAKKLGCGVVALAHHADDQVELFFLRLLRGSGGEGLSGMDPLASFPGEPMLVAARPLLDISKNDLLEYAKHQRIRFREDASNACLDHERNWVRHKLLPLLATRRSSFTETVRRAMSIIGAESDWTIESALRYRGKSFGQLALAVQRQVVRLQLLGQGIEPTFALVESLREHPEVPMTVSPQKSVRRDSSGRVHAISSVPLRFSRSRQAFAFGDAVRGGVQFGKLRIEWKVESGSGLAKRPASEAGQECFDADRIGPKVVLRHWRPGDRFQPIGTKAPMKLQDLFVNQKIPAARRREVVVAMTADRKIFWVEGLRIGEHAKLRPSTRRRLLWTWQRG